jgi:hypothetical protein
LLTDVGNVLQMLLSCMEDSWELMREAASNVLRGIGHPLPGFETPATVAALISQGVALMNNPKPEQADAGASLIALAHALYVSQLGWVIKAQGKAFEVMQDAGGGELLKSLDLVETVLSVADEVVADAELDMVATCRRGFLQGWLLAIRYICDDIAWDAVIRREAEACCYAPHTHNLKWLQALASNHLLAEPLPADMPAVCKFEVRDLDQCFACMPKPTSHSIFLTETYFSFYCMIPDSVVRTACMRYVACGDEARFLRCCRWQDPSLCCSTCFAPHFKQLMCACPTWMALST